MSSDILAGRMNGINTSIVDVRPFRSADKRNNESDKAQLANNEQAERCVEDLRIKLSPAIISVAQCENDQGKK